MNAWARLATSKVGTAMKDKPGSGLRVLSFFSGGGGLDLGFEDVGFHILRASDIDPASCTTLELNRGAFFSSDLVVHHEEDIRQVDLASLPRNIDLIIGGPPCQSFSASGRRAGGAAGRLDGRGNLFKAYYEVIEAVRPKAFVFENVRGILSTNKGEDWKEIVRTFAQLGYNLSHRILDALDFGAPQQRERMFLVGRRDRKAFLFPEPTHGPDSPQKVPYLTAGEALHGINEDEDVEALRLVDGKYAHLLPEVPPGQNYLFFTAKRGYPKPIFAYRSRFSDFLYKADPCQPVKTIIAKPGKYTGPLHWDNRYFTVKEYMRLQGFPDGYQFHGSRDDVIRQIGNSVSPKIARELARAVAQEIFGRDSGVRLLAGGHRLSFDKRKSAKATRTRDMHATVAKVQPASIVGLFQPQTYITEIRSGGISASVAAQTGPGGTRLTVSEVGQNRPFASFEFLISSPVPLRHRAGTRTEETLLLKVEGRGVAEVMPQLIWNAVDDWVQRTSHYHSLFELYGHFTEPYPSFEIFSFKQFGEGPYATFMSFAANMDNCSRYLDRTILTELFQQFPDWVEDASAIQKLREIRFDLRSTETNIAIPGDKFILAYPFTLPLRRQMNFSVKAPSAEAAEAAA